MDDINHIKNDVEYIQEDIKKYIDKYVDHSTFKSMRAYFNKSGYISIVLAKKRPAISFMISISICDYIIDDDLSIIMTIVPWSIGMKPPKDMIMSCSEKYLVRPDMIAPFIVAIISNVDANKYMYKNKPKMKSSMYGSQLYDIIVVTCDQ